MKRINKTYNRLFMALCTLALSACTALVEDLNNDPNNPTSAPFGNVLTGSQVGNIILQQGETARRAGIFSGYYQGIDRQHQGYENYTVTNSDFDGLWDDVFVNTLRNAKVAGALATEQGTGGVSLGITQVMEAMALGTAASLYGDIPFDDAADLAIENPAFEGQVAVYGKIQALLDEALLNLAAETDRPPGGADIYFDGDPAAWQAVAHSLKARYYMHTKEYANAYTSAQLGIASEAHSWVAHHGSGDEEANLAYQFFALQSRAADLVTNPFFVAMLDPNAGTNPQPERYRGHTKTNETARYAFLLHTTDVGVQPNTVNGWAGREATAPLLTYAENMLTLAEAGLRSQGMATGLSHLNSFRLYMNGGGYLVDADLAGVNYEAFETADFENGGLENADGIAAADALLREILEERYITLFGQIEGWCQVRRTQGETTVRVPLAPNTGTQLPQRFIYPQSEIDRNSNIPNPLPGFFEPTAVNQ